MVKKKAPVKKTSQRKTAKKKTTPKKTASGSKPPKKAVTVKGTKTRRPSAAGVSGRRLQEEQKKYKLLFSQINDLAAICDNKGNFLFLNDVFEKMTNHKPEEFIGKSFAPLLDDENLKIAIDGFTKALRGETPQFEVRFKDTGILCEFKDMPLRDEKGNITGVIGIGRDITGHKQMELEIQKSRDELELMVKERTAELESAFELLREEMTEHKQAEEAVLNIAKGVSSVVGDKFFYSLTENLAITLKADYAYVAEVIKGVPDRVRTLSLYADGVFIDNIEVDLTGTPCDTVREKIHSYPSGVQKLFPHAKTMAAMNVDGYAGTPLTASNGEWLGLMAVMYREPFKNAASVESMLKIFAARAAAELERKQVDEAMKIKDRAMESSINAICMSDPEANITYVNPSFKELWGYDSEKEILGRFALDFWHDKNKVAEIISILNEKGSWVGELVAIRKDGTFFDVQLSASMVKDNTGRPVCMMGSFLDITERKKVEKALGDSEKRFKMLAEESPNMIFINKKGRVVYANKKCEETMGYSREEFYSDNFNFLDLIAQEYKDLIKENYKMHMSGRDIPPYDYKIITKDGKELDSIITTKLMEFEGENSILGIITDITERVQAENALKESESNLKAVYENAGDGILIADIETMKFYGSNKMMCRLLGYSKEEIKNIGVMDIHRKEDLPYVMELFEKLVRNEIKTAQDVPFKRKDGQIFYADIKASSIIFSGKKCILGVFRDMTERKQAEEALRIAKKEIETWNRELEKRVKEKTIELVSSQEQLIQSEKLSAMGQMAGGLAHELNSPLAGLLPMIEKYREKSGEGSREHRELSLMLGACEHMAKIIRDFGAFSRKSQGKFYKLDLNEVIEDTLSFSANRFKQKRVRVIKTYEGALPAVLGEKTELQQVVLNMITNACDALHEGGELTIKTGLSKDKDNIIMEFIDNGAGIEKEKLDKIFDPFYTTKRPGSGTGLGLSVSYSIIEKHGGRISVESEPGKGTRFTIYLPAANEKKDKGGREK